jgi:chromosomal replication initiation ATPase DnaA
MSTVPIVPVFHDQQQSALAIFDEPNYSAAGFVAAASNAKALAWLNSTGEWPGGRLALWGDAGCGKTHLLHLWVERTGATFWRGAELRAFPDLPSSGIALDDAAATDERALFHLLNASAEADLPLLMASRSAPGRWPVQLPDLRSRLRAITAVEVGAPDDSLLRALLPRLLAQRLIRLPEPVLVWLLSRLPRTVPLLNEAVAKLHAVALEHHREITVPMARDVLAALLSADGDEISGTEAAPSPEERRLL